jgi:cation diffusion facilitator family transporter
MDPQTRKIKAALLSVVSNTSLMVMKFIVGFMIGSVSIISEAIHSGVDLLAAVVATFSVRASGVPADMKHPFGHGKLENISGTVEAILIFFAAGWIIYESVIKLINPEPIEYVVWGIGIMFVSIIVNIAVSKILFTVAKETDSIALEADAWHLRTDVYTSAGVTISLALILISQRLLPNHNIQWLDPVAAISVALLIIRTAYKLTLQSGRDLMDTKLPTDEETWIRHAIMSHQPAVCGFHRLRTRKAGNFRFIDFHIKVDPDMSVEASHNITDILSKSIENKFPHSSITIHTEPCKGKCIGDCLAGCLLTGKERERLVNKKGLA